MPPDHQGEAVAPGGLRLRWPFKAAGLIKRIQQAMVVLHLRWTLLVTVEEARHCHQVVAGVAAEAVEEGEEAAVSNHARSVA